MPLPRRGGILLHPTSLPGPFGSGDLGAGAYHFVDWLVAGRQSLWQVLPLGDIGLGNSPYMSPSAFAGNILLVDLRQLHEAGWLQDEDLEPDPAFEVCRVDYPSVIRFRIERLRRAAKRFFTGAPRDLRMAYDAFCADSRSWLDDYALFRALDTAFGGIAWQEWPAPLARYDGQALQDAARQYAGESDFWKFCQWCFSEQWAGLKSYANDRGIEIIGDVPIFVALHSADVWSHPDLFDLDAAGYPYFVSGVPPDPFSAEGQRWGNPLYRWPAHASQNYHWWVERMQAATRLYDLVRIDHFRGFESFWEIPADAETAVEGCWQPGPRTALFEELRRRLGELRFIAEDLGIITAEVNSLRKGAGLPGMRILQFAFDFNPENPYLPHNFERDTVVYTGTHDNDTTRGWWNSLAEREKDYVRRYLGINGDSVSRDMIRAAWASVAAFAIAPMQDVLGLDSANRMNRPGQGQGSWEWRFSWSQVESWHAGFLDELTRLYARSSRKIAAA